MRCLILDDEKSLDTIQCLISSYGEVGFLGYGNAKKEELEFFLARNSKDFFKYIDMNGVPDFLILDNDLGEEIEGYQVLKKVLNEKDCSNLKGFISCSLNTPARENANAYFSSWWRSVHSSCKK